MTGRTSRARRPLSAPGKLTVAALLLAALAYASEFLSIGQIDREIAIVVACLLAAAGLAATGWPLTAALGGLLAGAIMVMNPFLFFNLSNPANLPFFSAAVIQVCASLIALIAGITASIQQFVRSNQPH